MYSRPSGHRKRDASGKWQRRPHSGIGTVYSATEGEWEILVTHRQAGTSIRRDVFSATIRCKHPLHEEFLTGFSSKISAIDAARRRVKLLTSLHEKAARRRKRPRGE